MKTANREAAVVAFKDVIKGMIDEDHTLSVEDALILDHLLSLGYTVQLQITRFGRETIIKW